MENMSRRSFLKAMGTTTAATVLATSGMSAAERFADRKQKKVVAPEEPQKVKLACVGIANRGRQIIGDLERTGLCEIVALCDVDPNSKESQKTIAEHPNAKVFTDFRKLFDEYANEFEKEAPSPELRTYNGIDFYLVCNDEKNYVTWTSGKVDGVISYTDTELDIDRIIRSISGEK